MKQLTEVLVIVAAACAAVSLLAAEPITAEHAEATKVTVSKARGEVGDRTSLRATLWDSESRPVPGKLVSIRIADEKGGGVSVLTDSLGRAQVDYLVKEGTDPGEYPLTVAFAGDGSFLASSATNVLAVSKGRALLTSGNIIAHNNRPVVLRARLTNAVGQPIIGSTIVFSLRGFRVGSDTTDKDGWTTVVADSGSVTGTFTIRARFAGDRSHLRAKATSYLTVPSDVLRADEFLEVFDGFSIGSNDLTATCPRTRS
jgi:hypothetical protein